MLSGKTVWLLAGAGMAAVIIVGAGFAFTAANTVPATKGGEGTGSITGYNVASVHYTLNMADPTKVDSATFALDAAPIAGSTVRIRLETSSANWYSCAFVGVNVTCATTSPAASATTANQLQVVVAQ